MELPNLEGQPGWVVVVVFALFVTGTLGALYLRKRFKEDKKDSEQSREVEGKPATLALPAGAVGQPFDPVKEAMGLVAASAARNADDADRAEEEARMLSKHLAECEKERAVTLEKYAALERECQRLQAQLDACRNRNGQA